MGIKKNNVYLFLILTLILLIPWENLSPGRFEDLSTYRNYLSANDRNDEILFTAPIIFLFKEILFKKWLFFIYDFGFDADTVIFIAAFITVLIFFIATKRLQFDYRITLLLLCPLMIDFFNSQLRNSLAFSLFFLGFSFKNKVYKYLLFTFAIAFHLGILLLIATYFFVNFINAYITSKILRINIIIIFTGGCAFGDKIFFAILDDPRLDVYSSGSDMSLIYLLWSLTLFYFIILLKVRDINKLKELDYALVGSLLVVLSYFSGSYYGRYLAMFFPFILIAIGKFSIAKPVYLILLFYSAYTFTMNFIF